MKQSQLNSFPVKVKVSSGPAGPRPEMSCLQQWEVVIPAASHRHLILGVDLKHWLQPNWSKSQLGHFFHSVPSREVKRSCVMSTGGKQHFFPGWMIAWIFYNEYIQISFIQHIFSWLVMVVCNVYFFQPAVSGWSSAIIGCWNESRIAPRTT